MSRKSEPQELESEVLRHMPADVMRALRQTDRDEPLVNHLVTSFITQFVTDIDKRTLEVLTAKILAGTAAMKAATEAKRAVHELSRVDKELEKEVELSDLRQTSALAKEQARQDWYRLISTRFQVSEAELKARIAQLAVLTGTDAPHPQVRRLGDQLEEAWENIAGASDFRRRSDKEIDALRMEGQAEIAEDDPEREAKRAGMEAFAADMRSARDRLIRELWFGKS